LTLSKPELSVVIIGKNEANNICMCLDAVLDTTNGLQTEIVYVDSCSTDGTLEAASKYDITIIRLRENWVLSAAAGRYIGTINTKSQYILFCDADTMIFREWLYNALSYIRKHPDVGGVDGILIDVFSPRDIIAEKQASKETPQAIKSVGLTEHKSLRGGLCLYRREALERSGHFNPYMYSEEEWEICQRLRVLRFHLIRLPMYSGYHLTIKALTFKGLLRRRNYWNCYGQLLRICINRGGLWEFITGPAKSLTLFVVVLVSIAAATILSGHIGSGIWRYLLPLSILIMMEVIFTFRRKTITAFPIFIVRSIYMLWRMLIVVTSYKPMDASNYPTDAEVVKQL